ncbi:MAG: DUF4468 domain-containing protein [Bacteroidota bacterium]
MKKYFSVVALVLAGIFVSAQTQDPNSPGFDFNTTTDSTATPSDTQEGDQTAETAVVVKPYERIVLAMDTLTNLITYTGVVEQEESSSDSLYIRTKKWAIKTFSENGKSEPKAMYELDKKNQKLIINGSVPAYSYANKYAKQPNGKYLFKMTILIKEGRYKYSITNFAHEAIKPNQGSPNRNYFEYYYTTTTNIKGVDSILRYADRDINKMIESFKKALKEKPVVDEDEW